MKAFVETDIFVSAELLAEYRDVPSLMLSDGTLNSDQFNALIAGIAAVVAAARVVYPKQRIRVCRDPEDDMVLECCLAAGADHLVTGDKDLLSVGNLPFELAILTPKGYVDLPSMRSKR